MTAVDSRPLALVERNTPARADAIEVTATVERDGSVRVCRRYVRLRPARNLREYFVQDVAIEIAAATTVEVEDAPPSMAVEVRSLPYRDRVVHALAFHPAWSHGAITFAVRTEYRLNLEPAPGAIGYTIREAADELRMQVTAPADVVTWRGAGETHSAQPDRRTLRVRRPRVGERFAIEWTSKGVEI